jgi:subtilisin family serine protease
MSKTARYILLPPRGLTSGVVEAGVPEVASFFTSLETVRHAGMENQSDALESVNITSNMRVLDSIHENGAKLVELDEEAVSDLRAEQPGVRVVPVVYYQPARWMPEKVLTKYGAEKVLKKVTSRLGKKAAKKAAAKGKTPAAAKKAAAKTPATPGPLTVRVVSSADQSPIRGVTVVAFTDFTNRVGAQGKTDAKGEVALALGGASKKLERLYAYCEAGFWSQLRMNVTVKNAQTISLQAIDLSFQDSLRTFYPNGALTLGSGVKVGVIDTGIAPHPDLVIEGGINTVTGEVPSDFGDNGVGHGTHVAGIIAARGTAPKGIRGLSPGVTLRSYRVFPKKTGDKSLGASNFSIAKAIDRAVTDGCDLINMSLGGGAADEATHSAISHARASGVLVIVASGNDGRRPVSFPAADTLAIAVSAMGRKGTFPADSTQVGIVAKPFGTDSKDFIAAFSNVGPEIDLTGPGVGVISTFPGNTYAVLDGTSMACPAVVGAAARLLAGSPSILNMPRDQARSNAMVQLILSSARSLGFAGPFEGQGIL